MRAIWLALCSLLVVSFLFAQKSQASNLTLGSVSGQVVQEPSGMPIAKVEVSLASVNGGIEFSRWQRQRNALWTYTDSEGHFHIEGVPAGDYRISLQRNGFLPAGRKSQHDSPTSISVAKGEQLQGLFFRVLPAGVVKGRIVDEDGDPLPNVNLTAVTISGRGILGSATTNDLGEYRIAGLAVGKYLVLANGAQLDPANQSGTDAAEVYAPTFFPGTTELTQAASVDVHPGDETEAVFSLVATRTFSVRGKVPSLALGKPIGTNGVTTESVFLQRSGMPSGASFSTQVLPDGSFEITGIPPGTYTATVTSSEGSWKPVHGTETIEVRAADVDGLRLAPEPTGEVRGRFRMDDGQPFNWAQLNVYLDPEDRELQTGRSAKLAKDGSFKIDNVPAGNYHIIVAADSNNLSDYYMKEVNVNGKDAADFGFAAGPGV
jgi:hypothetical protein